MEVKSDARPTAIVSQSCESPIHVDSDSRSQELPCVDLHRKYFCCMQTSEEGNKHNCTKLKSQELQNMYHERPQ